MTNYNIYAGKRGKLKYLYTTLADNFLKATDLARQEMELEYELYNGTKTYNDAITEAEFIIHKNGLTLTSKTLSDKASEIYMEWKETWGEYKAVATEDDEIKENNLIFDYVINNES